MRIMITGASGYFGKLLAQRLRTDPTIDAEVIGVDIRGEETIGEEMKFLSGDTRKKRFEDIFKVEGKIDTVIHLARESDSSLSSDRLMMTNVYGTFHMLHLAQKYGVKQFVFPSASIVYGAREDNPALIREDFPLLGNRDIPSIRDRIEADLICQTHGETGAGTRVVILRVVPIWRTGGSGILTQYMQGDPVPILLGFDPMFQIMYDQEVLEAFVAAIRNPEADGAFNIHGRLFLPLSKVIQHLGKTVLPLPEFLIHSKGRFRWSKNLKFDFNYLKYPFTVDGTRAKEMLGYDPLK
jgi:UDP-glucose 4-epimerase